MARARLFLVAAKRTAFGAFGGSLKNVSSTELSAHASRAALADLPAELIETVCFGNVLPTAADATYLARHAALKAGVRIEVPALTLNRLCGSGFQSVVTVAQEILLGEAQVGLAGGAENMSQSPMSVYGQDVRWGTRLGQDMKLVDTLWAGLTDSYAGCAMGMTAENLAAEYGISRLASDEFALSSQEKWSAAHAAGAFRSEIAPIEVRGKKGMVSFETDEHPRATTIEKLGTLATTFKKDGIVTAGSASGICDGAAAIVVASEAAVTAHGLKPLAELVGWASVGVEPSVMGIGPVPAIQAAIERSGMTLDEMERVEINEAFAPQVLACAKALSLDMSKLNVKGGAIALGHPLGASGARITAHLAHAIANGEVKTAVGAACIGGGQGIALVLKAVQ